MNTINKSFRFESISHRGQYHGKRAEAILRSLSSPGGVIVEHHVRRALEEQGFDLIIDRDNKSVYDPTKLFDALKKYDGHSGLHVDDKTYKQALAITMANFGGSKTLLPISDKGELRKAIKGEKSSGAPLFTSKADAFDVDYMRMIKFAKGEVAAQPCVAYHRIQHGDSGPKTRLVWGYPLHMTLLEAKYARPLIEYFLDRRTPMAFGLHRHELAARLVPIGNSGVRYCFDFSGYDATLHPRLLSMAFMVLKSHFVSVDDLEWDRMVHYFIHTPIIMPDANLYVVHQGVPSGSFFTQLIDSVLNFFALQYAAIKLVGKPILPDKVLVLGDDGIFGFDAFIPISVWATTFKDLGLRLNSEKSEILRFGESVSFLGHTWDRGLVNRDLDDIAKRLAFPERIVKIDDPRLRIVSRVLAFGSDAINAHLIIMRWARYKGPDIRGIYFRETLTEPFLGWREFTSGDRIDVSFPKEALSQSYVGILT